jgi:hypothetical protein
MVLQSDSTLVRISCTSGMVTTAAMAPAANTLPISVVESATTGDIFVGGTDLDNGGTGIVWRVEPNGALMEFLELPGGVHAMTNVPNSFGDFQGRIAAVTGKSGIAFIDPTGIEPEVILPLLPAPGSFMSDLAFHPDGRLFVIGASGLYTLRADGTSSNLWPQFAGDALTLIPGTSRFIIVNHWASSTLPLDQLSVVEPGLLSITALASCPSDPGNGTHPAPLLFDGVGLIVAGCAGNPVVLHGIPFTP